MTDAAALAWAVLALAVCLAAALAVLVLRAKRHSLLGRQAAAAAAAQAVLERQVGELKDEVDALRARAVATSERAAALNTTLQHVDQGIMMVDASGTVVVYNDRVAEMLDWPATLLASRPAFLKILEYQWKTEEFSRTDEKLKESVRSGGIIEIPKVYERERPNGTTIEVRTKILPNGAMVRSFTDVTERKRTQSLIERAALHDELTQLPTRLALQQLLERGWEDAAAGPTQLLYLSLDRFRLLNDARGHEFGDRVLMDVAGRLTKACGAGDMVSRVGGDEFAILHRPTGAAEGETTLPDRLLRVIAEPHVIDEGRLSITASIGVVTVEPGVSASALLRHADIALNRAKDAGRNQFSHYTPSMTAARQERFQLEQSLRAAIGSNAFRLAYQPIVDVQHGHVVGYEALLRWTDQVRGEVSPAEFVPVAEATGLIVPLGRSILERACFEAASWSTERTVAVNLSPAQFQGNDLVETVRDILARSGLHPARLELEVTEGMLLENTSTVLETMTALGRIGVRLTLDDFGAGHAGLSYLRRFPFEKMKIDGSFIRTLGCDQGSDAIVEAILLLGRRLSMGVVAESVETKSQLDQLRDMQCPFVQGFYTGRPMTPEKARAL